MRPSAVALMRRCALSSSSTIPATRIVRRMIFFTTGTVSMPVTVTPCLPSETSFVSAS